MLWLRGAQRTVSTVIIGSVILVILLLQMCEALVAEEIRNVMYKSSHWTARIAWQLESIDPVPRWMTAATTGLSAWFFYTTCSKMMCLIPKRQTGTTLYIAGVATVVYYCG